MPSLSSALISSTPSNVPVTSVIALSKSSLHTGIRDVCLDCLDLIFVTFKPPASRSRACCDCNPIRAFETFDISKEPISKNPDSGCFGIIRVVIGSALSKGWCSRPEAFLAGHFLRLNRNRKRRMKSLWHPG